MRINTNVLALNIYNQYKEYGSQLTNSVRKMSSGLAINCAADDAAGLCISEKMRAQIRGLRAAESNVEGVLSLMRTADGALDSVCNILQRMRELAVKSSSDTFSDTERVAFQSEFSQLKEEIDDIAETTLFNSQPLFSDELSAQELEDLGDGMLNGDTADAFGESNGFVIQTGACEGDEHVINIDRMDLWTLGLSFCDISTRTSASSSTGMLDNAIGKLSEQRSNIGAQIESFDRIQNVVDKTMETLSAALSRILDVDIAKEFTNYTNAAIGQQVSIAIMAQANAIPQNVLRLIDGFKS
jgi:flagellin